MATLSVVLFTWGLSGTDAVGSRCNGVRPAASSSSSSPPSELMVPAATAMRVPSGLNATDCRAVPGRLNRPTSASVVTSRTSKVPSSPTVASRVPSGLNRASRSLPGPAGSGRPGPPVSRSHSHADPPPVTAANSGPRGWGVIATTAWSGKLSTVRPSSHTVSWPSRPPPSTV